MRSKELPADVAGVERIEPRLQVFDGGDGVRWDHLDEPSGEVTDVG